MGSGRGETPSTSISIFPFTGGQDKSGAETWQRRPAAPQLPVARMARRGGAASRAPSLLPPFACAPRSSVRPLGSGTGGVWTREREKRVAACPWSGGLQAPPAVPLSRAHPGGGGASQPRAQPCGRPGTCSPAGSPDLRCFPASPGAPWRFPSLPTFGTKLLEEQTRSPGFARVTGRNREYQV